MKTEHIVEKMAKLEFGKNFRRVEFQHFMRRWTAVVAGLNASMACDYPEDHNAVQRVIDGLDAERLECYATELIIIVDLNNRCLRRSAIVLKTQKATCRQKCEALLRMAGKWEKGE